MRALAPAFPVCAGCLISLAPPGVQAAITCSAKASALAFGNVDQINGTGLQSSATLDYECRNTDRDPVTITVCFSIGTGSTGGGSFSPRLMNNRLQFQLYQDGAGSDVWGSAFSSALRPYLWKPTVPGRRFGDIGGYGVASGHTTIHGRILTSGPAVPPGKYSSDFGGNHTALEVVFSGDCVGNIHGSFGFVAEAQVMKSCKVSADPMSFGAVPGSATSTDLRAQTSLRVKCSPQTEYTVTLTPSNGATSGAGAMTSAGSADKISYQLHRNAARTQPWGGTSALGQTGTGNGADQPLTVYGLVPSANVTPGTYTDNVTVRVSY